MVKVQWPTAGDGLQGGPWPLAARIPRSDAGANEVGPRAKGNRTVKRGWTVHLSG